MRQRSNTAWWIAVISAAALTALWAYFLPLRRVARGQNDFLAFYAGAKLAGAPDLYSAQTAKQMQAEMAGIWLPAVIYIRPPFYAALLKPLARMPYRAAYWLFQALNLAALASFLWKWGRRDPWLWALGAISIPVATAFANGQDILLLVWTCAAAYELETRGKQFRAGLLISLLAVKFHVFVFVPLVVALRRQWRTLAGTAAGGAALYAVAAGLQGWNWPAAYLRFLRTPQITPAFFTMPNLRGLGMAVASDGSAVALGVEAASALAVVAVLLYAAPRIREFGAAIALAVTAGLLTSHHAYVQDACLLLLIPALAPEKRRTRRAALAMLAPPAYFLLMADGPASALAPLGFLIVFAVLAREAVAASAQDAANLKVEIEAPDALHAAPQTGPPEPA